MFGRVVDLVGSKLECKRVPVAEAVRGVQRASAMLVIEPHQGFLCASVCSYVYMYWKYAPCGHFNAAKGESSTPSCFRSGSGAVLLPTCRSCLPRVHFAGPAYVYFCDNPQFERVSKELEMIVLCKSASKTGMIRRILCQ